MDEDPRVSGRLGSRAGEELVLSRKEAGQLPW